MSDPLDALRMPVVPVDPDPAFAARLRERLRRAVLEPPERAGGTVSTTGTTENRTSLRQGDVGYASLWVPDADRAAAFYGRVLGWRYRDGGSHEARTVEGANPAHGIWGGVERPNLMLAYAVDDLDAAVARVWDAGGRVTGPNRKPRRTVADCVDNQGLPFAMYELSGDAAAPAGGPRHGDLAYVTLGVPDSGRARAFYGAVLGWEFTPGRVEDGWTVKRDGADVRPMTGLWGGADRTAATVMPMYLVEDIEAAVAAVRAAGGTSTEPEKRPYGILAECVDDQGMAFSLGQW